MKRHMSVVCSVVFALLVGLPGHILAASITPTKAAIGEGCQATGDYSTAMGVSTIASGHGSTAMGNSTTAGGDHSTAMGCATEANGVYSTAIGYYTIAGGSNSFAGGTYMQLTGAANNTFVWGYSDSPQSISAANAFLIFPAGTAGRVGIGTPAPEHTLDIRGEADAMVLGRLNQVGTDRWFGWRFDRDAAEKWFIGMGPNDQNLLFRRTASSNDMVITEAGNVGIGTPAPNYLLEVNGDAAKPGGGTWTNSSDERLKDVTGEYQHGLDAVTRLRPVLFHYKEGNPRGLPTQEEYVGFIAQEVAEVFPEAVSEGPDGYLDFNMHPINVALVNAVKELKAENEVLKAENTAMREDIARIKAALGM